MEEHLAVLNKRQAIRILRKAGWNLVKSGGRHQVWSNGKSTLSLPHTLQGDGLYGWLAGQIRKIAAGQPLAKVYKRHP